MIMLSVLVVHTLKAADVSAVEHPQTVTLNAAVISHYAEFARTNHPRSKAAVARIAATQADAGSIRTWEDPTFKLGGTISSGRGPGLREDGDLIYGAEQKLPLFGKAQLQRTVVGEETRAAVAAADYQVQILRRDLALALFRAALAHRTVEIGSEDRDQLQVWIQNAEQRYAAGGGSQLEVLRLQNELTRRSQELITKTNEWGHLHVTVNRLLNRPGFASLPTFSLPEPAADLPYSEPVVTLAILNEPRLRAEINVAQAKETLARRQRLPEVSFGIEGRQFSGDGGFREGTFFVGMSLPWFNRRHYRQDVQREQHRAEAASWDAQDYELGVREEVHLLLVRADAARREALSYTAEILPRSELALSTAASSWTSNRGPFSDLMEGRRMRLEAQLGYARAVTEHYQALTELLLFCGLTDIEDFESSRKDGGTASPKTNQETK